MATNLASNRPPVSFYTDSPTFNTAGHTYAWPWLEVTEQKRIEMRHLISRKAVPLSQKSNARASSSLEKQMATHSSILAWRIPCTEEPGRLQSMGSQRGGYDWATNTHTHTYVLLLLLNHSVASDSLLPHGLQHARLPCPSLSPGVCSNYICILLVNLQCCVSVRCSTKWFIYVCVFSDSFPL